MGLFKRKETSKPPSVHEEKSDRASTASAHSAHLSLKSPRSTTTVNGFANMSLPENPLPPAPDPALDPAGYLRSIYAVRERSRLVLQRAKSNQLNHFDVDMSKFQDTAAYVVSIIKRDFSDDYSEIPPHGRWQHFDVGGRPRVNQLLQSWPSAVDQQERTRRLLDLFLVSVLLDAGAGIKWSYKSKESGKIYNRSEGLAVASLEMFKTGLFSSDPHQPHQVDAAGLKSLTVGALAKGLQVSDQNPMDGLEGRAGLLIRLSKALRMNTEYFGPKGRPGNMLDFLISHPTTQASSVPIVALPTLWTLLMDGLAAVWPSSRTLIDGVSLGDAWPCSDMPTSPPARLWETIVPFHKLTQWLCYSLMVPMTKLLKIRFAGAELMTGLPEYRNGGLLIDTGLISLKQPDMQRGLRAFKENARHKGQPNMEVVPLFEPSDDVIVEWRAVTVGFLDELLEEVNNGLNLAGNNRLSLPQMLEAGTWKGGREIAAVSRPNTKEPPIMIISDGTVF